VDAERDPKSFSDFDLALEESDSGFSRLSPENQRAAFLRLWTKADRWGNYATSVQLDVQRAVSRLSFEQASLLLEALLREQKRGGEDFVLESLAMRLVDVDPERAARLFRKNGNERYSDLTVAALAEKNPADALRFLWSRDEHGRLFGNPFGGFFPLLRPENRPPSFEELEQLLDGHLEAAREGAGMELLGATLAHACAGDMVALSEWLRGIFGRLQTVQVETVGASNPMDAILMERMVAGAYEQFLSASSEAASLFFDSLLEGQKTSDLISREALQRFRKEGVEGAVRLTEGLEDPLLARAVAGAVWRELERNNPASARHWVGTLPEGAFRRGVLAAMDSDAGASLPSARDRVDFFTEHLKRQTGFSIRWEPRQTMDEEVEKLPLTPDEKRELLSRLAPIQNP
jgi:hypothetical protein